MSSFAYQARDGHGRPDNGVVSAGSPEEASRLLRQEGKTVLSISREIVGLSARRSPRAVKKVRRDDVISFATQLAVMVDTGVTITEALDAIAAQMTHTGMRPVVEDLAEQIKGGTEFSVALEKHSRLFDGLFVALMRASEASGTMGLMLQRAGDHMAAEREIRKRIKGALTYPICMMAFCLLVVTGLMIFILPRFEKIYRGKGAILPAPTRILMAASHGLVEYWPVVLASLVAAGVGTYLYFRTQAGRRLIDHLKISTPLVGSLYRKACLARSLRTLATMISSGVTMLDALKITGSAAGNRFYAGIWRNVSDRISGGSSLSSPLFDCKLIPPTVAQMISAGEKSGRLGDVMDRIAKFCEDDLSIAAKTLTSLIEPAMIVVMGLVVGGVALALLLPVFRISRVVSG